VNALDELLRAEGATLALEMVRITGMVVAAPLAWAPAPMRVRGGLVVLLALAAHGASPPAAAQQLGLDAMCFAAGSEFVLGLGIGFVVRLVIATAEIAAELIAPMMGIGIAQIFDPQTRNMQNVLDTILRNFATLLALIAGLHRIAVSAVLQSFRIVPVGSLTNPALAVPSIVAMTADALASGVRIAIPLIAVLFTVHVALAFIARAAPAMQIFSVGFAVTLAAGGLVLILVLPDLGYGFLSEVSRAGYKIEELVSVAQGTLSHG
jgi:flagellar biosynthetic protein FliR